ncbi:MAG TPA: GNAT family N-acetyltransferase [Caldilineaceae bacterium]|nr:GNAT family N-acetyltransferase [Caldilineaceae bacterium]
MDSQFVADEFVVPQLVERQNYVLRPLTTADVENDYEAVMSSRESLRQVFREHDEWPAEQMTLQDNYRDLERHQTDFERRQGFTYTMETPDGARCLGCVYIYPCQRGDYDAQVYYWVRDSVKANGIEEDLGAFLRQWLRQVWPFRQPVLPGRELSWREWEALESAAS